MSGQCLFVIHIHPLSIFIMFTSEREARGRGREAEIEYKGEQIVVVI